MRRLTLPAMLAAAALGLAGFAPAAHADTATTVNFEPVSTVKFESSTFGYVTVDYTCADPTPESLLLRADVLQADGSTASGGLSADPCTGGPQTGTIYLYGSGITEGSSVTLTVEPYAPVSGRLTTKATVVMLPQIPTGSIALVGAIPFKDATHGQGTLDYTCFDPASEVVNLRVDGENSSEGTAAVTCDGKQHRVIVPLVAESYGYDVGSQHVDVYAHISPSSTVSSQTTLETTSVLTRSATAPAPVPVVTITLDASPETVTKGKKITVKGIVRNDGKRLPKAKLELEFVADSDGNVDLYKVKATSKGDLKTTVKAKESGTFTFLYKGAESNSDHIIVKKPLPKPKKYKNCKALNKVYPHGVGKKGARDKGGDVNNFTRDSTTYGKNKKSDRDKDGIVCERD